MAVSKLLEEAAERIREASLRIEQAQEAPSSADSHRIWLEALTDYCRALADIQSYNNESIHEKLHKLAGRGGLRKFPTSD